MAELINIFNKNMDKDTEGRLVKSNYKNNFTKKGLFQKSELKLTRMDKIVYIGIQRVYCLK